VAAATGVAMGGYGEYVRVPAAAAAPVPDAVDLADAAAIIEGGLTALPFLRDHAALRPGQRVLVNGASGAVGTAAVQLAAHLGAHVTGVCGSHNVDLVRSLGAEEVIDYSTADFTARPAEFDVVFDAVGKSSFRRARRVLRDGGVYLTTVPSLPILVHAPWTRLVGRHRAVLAFTGLRSTEDKARDCAELVALAATGRIRAVVDHRWPLAQAAEAHRHVDGGHKRGAVLLTVGQ
jgi:NADPH:quinone reductase-like Zn-dependent oxidoreductase